MLPQCMLTYARFIVQSNVVSIVAAAHIVSIGIGAHLIATTCIKSTFIHICKFGSKLCYDWRSLRRQNITGYELTHTSLVVRRDCISKIAITKIASIRIGAYLIAVSNTESTFIYICMKEFHSWYSLKLNCTTVGLYV